MKTEILSDLKRITDGQRRVAELRNWGLLSMVVTLVAVFYIPDYTWKLSTASVAGLVSLLFFAQSRRSVNITIDEDKRKYLGLNRGLVPASHSGLSSKTLPETSEYQNREPRYKNIVQIPSVPARIVEPDLTPRALKDRFDRNNFTSAEKVPVVPEMQPSSPDVNRFQDSGFMSPIATPRRRRSGSFGSGNNAFSNNINGSGGGSGQINSIFRNPQAASLAPSTAGTPAKTFHEQMTAMNNTLATAMSSTPKGATAAYQPSPINSPYQLRHDARQQLHKLSPTPMVNVVSRSYYSTTYDVSSEVSAASWLGLTEVPDEWSESFRFVLGRHLHDQLKLFDNVVEEIFTQLTLKAASNQAGGISQSDLLKAQRLLEFQEEKLHLDNGTTAGADEVLEYCRAVGIYATLIHRYELCLTLFRMPRILDSSNSDSSSGSVSLGSQPAASGNKNRDTVMFLKRLRELASNCPDGRLRITWERNAPPAAATRSKYSGIFGPSTPSRAGTDSFSAKKGNELSDQDIVMLLFLHKCDFHNTIWSRSIEQQHRFSAKHFVNNGGEINQIVKSYFANCHTQAQLNQQLALMPKAVLFRSQTNGVSTNHFDVVSMTPYAEIIKVDEGRNDCFESIIVFLLVVYKTLAVEHFQKNGNDSSSSAGVSGSNNFSASGTGVSSHGMFALGTSGGINVSMVKDLLQDIFSTKEEIGDYLSTAYGLKLVDGW